MSDIGIFSVDNCFQLVVEDGDLKGDDSLETAVIISLWSDQRVTEDELPAGHDFKRGWWGDIYPDVEGDKIGSKIWVLSRAKSTAENLAALENYATEALEWMINDGVAKSVSVIAAFDDNSSATMAIEIERPSGDTDRFSANWDAQKILRS